MEFVQQHT